MEFTKKVKNRYTVQAEEEQFLPKNLVMIDCEMTGVVPSRDYLLQVAALKLELVLEGTPAYKEIGEPFVAYLHYQGKPEGEFQEKYLREIFEKCNKSDLTPAAFKEQFTLWLTPFAKGKVSPVGDCVPTDIAFLLEKGCIDPNDINQKTNEAIQGTFHYEFFEMNALKLVARQKMGKKLNKPTGYDEDHIHDALTDCRNQLLELNQVLDVLLT